MASKYDAGDQFIARRNINQFFTKGRTYTIQSEGCGEDHYYLNDDEGGTMHGAPLDWLESEFIPVSRSPIRTVTRREIVPGRYGGVRLYDDGSATVDDCTDADACRAAAHIFNEIADVLDEQKEAA